MTPTLYPISPYQISLYPIPGLPISGVPASGLPEGRARPDGPTWLGAFSGGVPGSQTLDFSLATRLALEAARRQGIPREGGTGHLPLMVVDQVHSADLWAWDGAPWPTGRPLPKADGILVLPRLVPPRQGRPVPGLVATRTADCVPILAWGVESGAYAAVHAGWRGVALGILPRLVAAWQNAGLALGELRLALGPSIQVCCFEVGPDALGQFKAPWLEGHVHHHIDGRPTAGGKPHLDLHGVLATQADELGLGAHQITRVAHCTRCAVRVEVAGETPGRHPFASHRRHMATGEPRRFNTSFIGCLL